MSSLPGTPRRFPIKQGGLAAQQADAAAATIAALAGAPVEPRPPDLLLRAALLTGSAPRFLRAALSDREATSTAGRSVLWWPPGKIAARHLAPYLAGRTEGGQPPPLDDVEALLGEEAEAAEADRTAALELALTRGRRGRRLGGLRQRAHVARGRREAERDPAAGLRAETRRMEPLASARRRRAAARRLTAKAAGALAGLCPRPGSRAADIRCEIHASTIPSANATITAKPSPSTRSAAAIATTTNVSTDRWIAIQRSFLMETPLATAAILRRRPQSDPG